MKCLVDYKRDTGISDPQDHFAVVVHCVTQVKVK